MPNDLTTPQGSFQQLIDDLEDNLQAMGIQNATFDSTNGIRGLVSEILNIEPSVSGLELTTDFILPTTFIKEGSIFNFDVQLIAYYDDTTQANVDLSGYITNATIELYDENEDLVTTTVTNNNGQVSFNVSEGDYHIVFNGTENFESCDDYISVSTPVSLTVSSNKDILSYADNESAVITLTINGLKAVPNKARYSVLHNNEIIDNGIMSTFDPITGLDSDDNTIQYYEYTSQGIGDVTIVMEYEHNNIFLQETYEVIDALRYDSCQSDKTSQYTTPSVFRGSGTPLFSFESGYGYKLGKSSGNGDVRLPFHDITNLSKFKLEFDQQTTTINNNSNTGFVFYKDSSNYHEFFYGVTNNGNNCNTYNLTCVNGSTNYTYPSAPTITANTLLHYEITRNNNSITVKITNGNTVLHESTFNLAITPNNIGILTGWTNGYSYIKNILIKAL